MKVHDPVKEPVISGSWILTWLRLTDTRSPSAENALSVRDS